MEKMKFRKSARPHEKIEELRKKMSREDDNLAAHILQCIVTGRYFDFDDIAEKQPLAIEYAYLHLNQEVIR